MLSVEHTVRCGDFDFRCEIDYHWNDGTIRVDRVDVLESWYVSESDGSRHRLEWDDEREARRMVMTELQTDGLQIDELRSAALEQEWNDKQHALSWDDHRAIEDRRPTADKS